MREIFGVFLQFFYLLIVFKGRVRFMLTASAPIAENVITFLKIALSCPIVELYGIILIFSFTFFSL